MATTLNDQIGRVLGGRYRLIAPIGTGASAQVYLADDTTLRRRVAVKVLHQGLATDETFLRRFRAEAQAAAGMNHPHIMAVYDWGEDDVPYLVSEYLGGGSLRAMFDAGSRFSVSQALMVGLEAARGLEYAHRQKIVHRDIKPANLLFDDEGRLRIADFGIARALAEAGLTEQGTVVGTARYASPEQAKSESLTGKSDVYALALVLVEAVTGDVPFTADTPLGTLVARIDQQLPVPKELGPLRRVVERAGSPDPEQRPDAGEFIIGLMAAAEECARPAPLPLVGALPSEPLGDGASSADPTQISAAPVPAPPAPVAVPPTSPAVDTTRVFERLERTPAPRGPAAGAAPAVPFDDEDDDHHRRRWPWVLLGLLLVLGAAGGGVAAYLANRTISHELPLDVVGMSEADFTALVERNDWVLGERREARTDDVDAGEVITTEPLPGNDLAEGETVHYAVSIGPNAVTVPDLTGMAIPQIDETLRGAGLRLAADVPTENSEDIPLGQFVRLAKPDDPVFPGGEVQVIISDGPVKRLIPVELVNQPYAATEANFAQQTLVPQRVEAFSDTVATGNVIGFKTADGAADVVPGQTPVDKGATVQVLVSKGRAPVKVPDVSGLTVPQARERLVAMGFTIDSVTGDPAKSVINTDPPAGDELPYGSAVVIIARRN